jgi:adenine-specific DNA-methyltransferase
LLGINNGTAIVLLYNGILGDRRPNAGNVLTHEVWKAIGKMRQGPTVVYGEACLLSAARLKTLDVTFRQIPYDIRMR